MKQDIEYGYNNRKIFVDMPLPNVPDYPYEWPAVGVMDDFGDVVPVDCFEHGWDEHPHWLGEDPTSYAPQGH